MQITPETLIEAQEPPDAEGRQEERDGEPRRVGREQQHPTGNGAARSGECKHRRQNRTDARRPAERKRDAKQETTPNARLSTLRAEMYVAIQPTRHRRPEKTNNRKREEMNGAKTGEESTALQRSKEAEGDEHNSDPAPTRKLSFASQPMR